MNWRDKGSERRAITVFVIIILVLFIVALVGWLNGAWEAQ